jgi:predicted DNA-binding transcriptional regulator AlpA
MPVQEAPDLLTTKELAAYLRKPVATVRGWRYRKVGPTGFRLGREVVYRRSAVDAWLAEREQTT